MGTLLYYGRDKKVKYELDSEIRHGGEGIVYTIKGKPGIVAKVYKKERISDPQIREATKNKMLAMLDMNFDPRVNGKLIVAWPEDILLDGVGTFWGFVMPKIENMKSLIWAIRPSDRISFFPNGYRWHYSVAIAFNLALTIEQLHNTGIVVGDMNTNNILVDNKGNVTLIDADSFNITTKAGKIYKCIVGFPEVLPAELQGKDLTKQQFNERTDVFALAIHIFTLLCNNCHPFGCINYNIAHGSSSNPKIMDNIVRGFCPYVKGTSKGGVDDALDMDIFPGQIRKLFDRAFNYDVTTAVKASTIANRPSANEWRVQLGELYRTGVNICIINPLHEYPKSFHGDCPWCAIEKRKSPNVTSNIPNLIKNSATVPVMYCDKDGNTLRTGILDIEYGKKCVALAQNIPGYHIIGNRMKIEVSVDFAGKPSETPIYFTYEKDKQRKSLKKPLIIALLIGVLYCIIMYGMAMEAVKQGDSVKTEQYMNLLPFYKNLFSTEYNYNLAISNYRDEYYYSAYELFDAIDYTYKQTSLYLTFCDAHMSDWPEEYYSTIFDNIDFEDAKDLLAWDDEMFCRYMMGSWMTNTSDGDQIVTVTEEGDNYVVNNIPELPGGGTFSIYRGVMEYQFPNTDEWTDYYSINVLSENKMSLYSYESGNTYTLIRE